MSLRRLFRSAGTGRFITKGEADSTPDWSVSETVDSELLAAAQQVVLSRSYELHGRVSVNADSLDRLERAVKR